MIATGKDKEGRILKLPGTLEEYFSGTAKRFANITELSLIFEKEDKEAGFAFEIKAGSVFGDFSLLRAFLADHDRSLFVWLKDAGDGKNLFELRLFFPAYLYGFVEDTFARAIHHKIEGAGYACRECVGKRELRLREYDGLFRLVSEDDSEN